MSIICQWPIYSSLTIIPKIFIYGTWFIFRAYDTYTLGEDKKIEIIVLIENRAEDAFESVLNITFPPGVTYYRTKNMKSVSLKNFTFPWVKFPETCPNFRFIWAKLVFIISTAPSRSFPVFKIFNFHPCISCTVIIYIFFKKLFFFKFILAESVSFSCMFLC